MRQLVHQAALHLGARLASVGVSFILFAWIGKVLVASDAANAYAFTYALGFGLAAARMTLQIGAGITGHERLAQRMREAHRGLALLKTLLPLLFVGVAAAAWSHTHSLVLSVAAGVVAVAASLDIDLLRGTTGRASLFSSSFAIGCAIALAMLVFVLPHTLNGVVIALLIQWIPTCAINVRTWPRLRAARLPARTPWTDVLATLLLSTFDGLVLNVPFLGIFMLPVALVLDMSLIVRIYVASLPMLPLLLHWMNSPAFGHACRRIGLSLQSGFMVGLLLSGVLSGSVFIGAYVLVANKQADLSTIVLYLALLVAYAIFAPQMRLASARWTKTALILPLAASQAAFLAGVGLLAWLHYPLGAYAIVALQMLALLGTARWLSRHDTTARALELPESLLEE